MSNESLLNNIMTQLIDYSRDNFGDKFQQAVLYEESDIDIMIIVDMSPEELRNYRWDLSCFCADLNLKYDTLITSKLQSLKIFEQWKDVLPFYQNVLKELPGGDNILSHQYYRFFGNHTEKRKVL